MPQPISKLIFTISAFVLLALPAPAAVNEGFSETFRDQARETRHFSKGRQAEFYRDADRYGYGTSVKGLIAQSAPRDINARENLTTLMLSGTYELPKRLDRTVALHPFVTGGVGLAVYEGGEAIADATGASTQLVPVLRVGAGLAYKVNEKVDLSLSYKTGLAATRSSQDRVNLNIAEVGVKLKF